MKITSEILENFFDEYAELYDLSGEEIAEELESYLIGHHGGHIARSFLSSLYILEPFLTPAKQQHMFITIMAYLLNELIDAEFTLPKAMEKLKRRYTEIKRLSKKNEASERIYNGIIRDMIFRDK